MQSLKLIAASVILAVSSFAGSAHAVVIDMGLVSVDDGDPLQNGRLERNGVVSTLGSVKPFPGIFTNDPLNYEVVNFNTGAFTQIVWTYTYDDGVGTNIFSVAYDGFDPTNIATGYLGDPGFSVIETDPGPRSAGIDVLPFQDLQLIFHVVNPTGNFGTISYTIEGFSPVRVSEPTSLALLGSSLAGLALLGRRRRRLS